MSPPALVSAAVADAADAAPVTAVPVAVPPRRSSRRLAVFLMAGAMLSKMLGLVREVLIALVLGTTFAADGYRGALTVVLLPLALMLNESVPAIMIPMHRAWQKAGVAARGLTSLTAALTCFAVLLTVAVQAAGPIWVDALLGGFGPEAKATTLGFVRLMALAMPGIVMVSCLSSGEIALGLSRLTSLRAGMQNVSVLLGLGIYVVTGYLDALALFFAIGLDGLAVWGAWRLWREGHLDPAGLRPALVWGAGRDFLRGLRPLLPLPVAEQGNIWIERTLASGFVAGTVASLDYARSLTESALLLISQPLGLVVLSRDPSEDAGAQVEAIARPILAAALPLSAFVAFFAPEVASFVYARGAFNAESVWLTSQVLTGISTGLWASTLGWILLRILNSGGRNLVAAMVLAAAYAANVAFNVVMWHLPSIHGYGPLLLGFGEATRGVVLLAGTVLMLGCGLRVLRLVALGALPAGLMLLVSWQVHAHVEGVFARLVAGGSACLLCIALGFLLLMPSIYGVVLARLRAVLSRSEIAR